jgi:hypothetical protein
MLSNRLAFAALAIGCLAAAAGGGYLASRQNAVPAPASAQAAPAAVVVPSQAATPLRPVQPVQETGAVIGNATTSSVTTGSAVKAPALSPASAPLAPKTAAARRVDLPARASTARAMRQVQTPTLTNTWPTSAASQPPATPAPAPPDIVAMPRPDDRAERAAPEPPRAPEPPQRTFEELVVSADSVIGLQTQNRISSETARVEDRIDARVTRDVRVGDRVAIPAGSRALGSVMLVERGGKFKEKARLGIRFHTLVLADGTRLPITTDTIYRDGDPPGNASAQKMGGAAVGGAILGAILGGSKGAAIGGAAGAGAGAAAVVAGDKNAATFPSGTQMTIRILLPVTVTTDK